MDEFDMMILLGPVGRQPAELFQMGEAFTERFRRIEWLQPRMAGRQSMKGFEGIQCHRGTEEGASEFRAGFKSIGTALRGKGRADIKSGRICEFLKTQKDGWNREGRCIPLFAGFVFGSRSSDDSIGQSEQRSARHAGRRCNSFVDNQLREIGVHDRFAGRTTRRGGGLCSWNTPPALLPNDSLLIYRR